VTTPVSIYPGASSFVGMAGVSVVAAYGPILGGLLTNPLSATDQGLQTAEPLFADLTAPAALSETPTTVELLPGASFTIPANFGGTLWVNAPTAMHRFSCYVVQTQTMFPPTDTSNSEGFPPAGPTTMTDTIPSYLYQQYNDDQDLQAFVAAFNAAARQYVGWLRDTNLADYRTLSGALLDWVALGLYGLMRPTLGSGGNRNLGPFGTYAFGTPPAYASLKRLGPLNVAATSDDTFQRVMTWALYHGDGRVFNVRWLKRRVMRFLNGVNGVDPGVNQTYDVSVQFGSSGVVAILISAGTRKVTRGQLGTYTFGTLGYGYGVTQFTSNPHQYPAATLLQEALASGALEFPFQFTPNVTVQ
jgi:hypothetical protein